VNSQIPHIFKSRILISPLNWGFGHVSRTIPIIQSFLEKGNEVFIACNAEQKNIYEMYFLSTKVKFLSLEGYPFRFRGKGNFGLDLFFSIFPLFKHILKEHLLTEKWVKDYSIDFVISDHRYGVYSKNTASIFLTHQYNLPTAPFSILANWAHHRLIHPFHKIWIADSESTNLAGILSSCPSEKAIYIGALSRFNRRLENIEKTKNTLIISGPAAYWEDLILLFGLELSTGKIDSIIGPKNAQSLFNHFEANYYTNEDWLLCDNILIETKKLFGFCGYSTIMDIAYLKCESKLVPCKGQYEQLYLYQLHYSHQNQ